MSDLQVSTLISAMEENPKLKAQWRALLGLKDEDSETPAPKDTRPAEDHVPAPGKDTSKGKETDTSGLQAQKQTAPESAGDILATLHDLSLVRRVPQQKNYFLPSAIRMMHQLSHMDRIIIRKFKARRSAQLLFPPLNTVYYAILWSIQTARCLEFAGYLETIEDKLFLKELLDYYPPESLPIAGPLLPFFKAVTTFRHENPTYKRISPGFPASSLNASANGRQISHNQGNISFPNVPYLIDLYHRILKKLYGNDVDSEPTAALLKEVLKLPFPFTFDAGTAPPYAADQTIGGFTFVADPTRHNDTVLSAHSTPGASIAPSLNLDVCKTFAPAAADYILGTPSTAVYATSNLQSWLRMSDLSWFGNVLSSVSEHASLFIGSGTLADCSVDGMSSGAYTFKYTGLPVALTRPTAPYDKSGQFNLNGSLFTTLSTPSVIEERLAAFSQVHIQLPVNHWYDLGPNVRRNGNVWNLQPIYGPSSEVTNAMTTQLAIEKFIDPKVAK